MVGVVRGDRMGGLEGERSGDCVTDSLSSWWLELSPGGNHCIKLLP